MHSQKQSHPPAPRAEPSPPEPGVHPAPPAPGEDDFALMQGIVARQSDALATLYDRHAPAVHALCLRILKDPGLAEDVMLDVFQEVWAKADRFNAARGTPIAYLLTLARSRSLDRLRSRATQRAGPLHDNTEAEGQAHPAPGPFDAAIADERRSIVVHALAQLDPKYREVLECAYFDGLSHTEIAAKLNKPVGTVKTYLRRGLIQLRDFVRNPDEEVRPKSDG